MINILKSALNIINITHLKVWDRISIKSFSPCYGTKYLVGKIFWFSNFLHIYLHWKRQNYDDRITFRLITKNSFCKTILLILDNQHPNHEKHWQFLKYTMCVILDLQYQLCFLVDKEELSPKYAAALWWDSHTDLEVLV